MTCGLRVISVRHKTRQNLTYKIAKTKRSNATNLGFVSIKRMSAADILIIHRHTHKYIYRYIYIYMYTYLKVGQINDT